MMGPRGFCRCADAVLVDNDAMACTPIILSEECQTVTRQAIGAKYVMVHGRGRSVTRLGLWWESRTLCGFVASVLVQTGCFRGTSSGYLRIGMCLMQNCGRYTDGNSRSIPRAVLLEPIRRVNASEHEMVAEADVEVRRCLAGIVLTL